MHSRQVVEGIYWGLVVSEVQNFSWFLDRPERNQLIEAIDGPADNPHIGILLKGDFPGLLWLRVGPCRVI